MKKAATLLFLFCSAVAAAQVTYSVDFNTYTSATDNDLSNHFYYTPPSDSDLFIQTITGGISGGALTPPATLDSTKDFATYCGAYLYTDTIAGSIDFYLDTTVGNFSGISRVVTVRLKGVTSGEVIDYSYNLDHNGRAHVSHDCMGAEGQSFFDVHNQHWYRLVWRLWNYPVSISTAYIQMQHQLFDLGPDGTALPDSVTANESPAMNSLIHDEAQYTVAISGSSNNGAKHLDNFYFKGMAGDDHCHPQGISSVPLREIRIINPVAEIMHLQLPEASGRIMIYSITGNILSSCEVHREHSDLNVSFLSPGLYWLYYFDYANNRMIRKFTKL